MLLPEFQPEQEANHRIEVKAKKIRRKNVIYRLKQKRHQIQPVRKEIERQRCRQKRYKSSKT